MLCRTPVVVWHLLLALFCVLVSVFVRVVVYYIEQRKLRCGSSLIDLSISLFMVHHFTKLGSIEVELVKLEQKHPVK